MTPQERELIQGLFDRISRTSGPRDPEAVRLIEDEVQANREAAYYLVQAVLVQEEALKAASARIEELEAAQAQAPKPSGSFLGGSGPWGARPGRQEAPRTIDAPPPGYGRGGMPPPLPQGGRSGGYNAPQQQGGPQPGGPSFLRGAMTTAAGVAGGALLFSGISSLMGGSGLFGGGQSAAGQGLTGASASNQDSGGGREDVSGFEREGFQNSSAQDDEWNRHSDGGGVQEASWSDDGGGDWGGGDDI